MSTLSDILTVAASGADALGSALAPKYAEADVITKIIGIALRSGAKFAAAGKDPVAEIQRIHSADPLLKDVEEDWNDHLNRRFPRSEPPEPARDPDEVPTAPPSDDYED
jgi:hypothetical protein